MHKTDIARTRRNVERVADKAQEIASQAETVEQAGFDPSQSPQVLSDQRELVNLLAQAIADFNELTTRAETIEPNPVSYSPSDCFDFDVVDTTLTITYTGSVELANVTVTKAGSDITPFTLPLTNGTSVDLDISALNVGDTVTIEYTATRDTSPIQIKTWGDITGTKAPQISATNVELPAHSLIPETQTRVETFRL